MRDEDAPRRVHEIGAEVQEFWEHLADANSMTITTSGLPALANFTINGLDTMAVKTFMTRKMLDQGYLAGVNLYASLAHTQQILSEYFDAITPIFASLAHMDNDDLQGHLPAGSAQSGFTRLT